MIHKYSIGIVSYIFLLFITILLSDLTWTTDSHYPATVIDKHYLPSVSFDAAKHIIIIRTADGDIHTATATANLYFQLDSGQKVQICKKVGTLLKIQYSTTVTKKLD